MGKYQEHFDSLFHDPFNYFPQELITQNCVKVELQSAGDMRE